MTQNDQFSHPCKYWFFYPLTLKTKVLRICGFLWVNVYSKT